MEYSGVQWCTVEYSFVQWCTVVCSGVQWCTVGTVVHGKVQCGVQFGIYYYYYLLFVLMNEIVVRL